MKGLMKTYLFLSLFFVAGVLAYSQNDSLFKQGNKLYNDGEYQAAITKYQKILENGKHSAEVYFNLANAHYKLNHIAPSIYYYEKALQLKPNDKDINNNVGFARNMTIDAIEKVPEVGFSRFMKSIVNTFSYNTWGMISIGFMILFVLFFLTYYFTYSTGKKRISFVLSLCSFGVSLTMLFFAFSKSGLDAKDQPAIVFAQETQVKSEPNLRSNEVFLLHEGTKVQILDTVNNWKRIKLADGKTGWIIAGDLKAL